MDLKETREGKLDPEGKCHSVEVGVDGKISLKWTIKKYNTIICNL
jgi:hypothetical protein